MNVRDDLSDYFNTLIQYIQDRAAIEELEQFFEKWQDPVRPEENKPIHIRLHYLRVMRETFDLTEHLNDLHEKMSQDASKKMRQSFLEIVALWPDIQEKPEYEDWRIALQPVFESWKQLPLTSILNKLMNSYEDLHQLLTDRQDDCLSVESVRRLKKFTVLLERCEFMTSMHYLSGNFAANKVDIADNISHSAQKYLHFFNLASDRAKALFIIDLHNHFLGTTQKTLKKVDQNILFDKLNEQQQDRFRMFANNEGTEFNASREAESIRMRVMEKAEAAAKKRLLKAN